MCPTGNLPPAYSYLTDLETLDLSGNGYILGCIPPEWTDLVSLTRLDLTGTTASNQLPPGAR